jgi:putative membrane protein insertion efficiency factor
MGHRNSSAALSGAGAFRAPRSGAHPPAPKHRPKSLSPFARILLAAIRTYQVFFSALMPSACKFYPSCSQYAADAVQLHGARRGSWLAVRRLARCHPFTPGGVDLVPDATEYPCDGNITVQPQIPKDAGETGAGSTRRRHRAGFGASATCTPPKSEVHL